MITDFKDKKLVEYLEPGKKYLIRFGHGLGDTLMFMPIFEKLQQLYSRCAIDLYVESGQEQLFESYPEKDSRDHDLVFSLTFPMAESTKLTKAEKCCIDEIGIEYNGIREVTKLREESSPFVGVHFQGTALPNSVNCPPNIAQKIWNDIIKAGFIPIECHYQHMFHNPINDKYGFISNTVRNCNPEIRKLVGLVQRCYAFIGVASGPFVVALSVMPKNTLYLQRLHKLETYTRNEDVDRIDITQPYKDGCVERWLKAL